MPTYLLTWNPENFAWTDLPSVAARVRAGDVVQDRWSAGGTQQIRMGDRIFLLRQGVEPKGIVASGRAASDWYEDRHWDESRPNDTTTYVDVVFDRLIDPSGNPSEILSTAALADLVPGLQTSIARSGTRIPDDIAFGVEQLWSPGHRIEVRRHNHFPPEVTRDDVLEAMQYYRQHGLPPTFGPSTDYDLELDGERFPPKVIASLAARKYRGRLLFSQEFTGGVDSACFRVLQAAGFTMVPKTQRAVPFRVDKEYTREEIKRLLGLPVTRGGDWDTGHHREGDDTYIFANVGSPGRTGHDYANRWEGDLFHWQTKGPLSQSSASVQAMLNPPGDGRVFIFTRESDRSPFVFEGFGRPVRVEGDRPVTITWSIEGRSEIALPGEEATGGTLTEGTRRTVTVQVAERNPQARRACLRHYGSACVVCGVNFEDALGDVGRGIIQVHHLNPISDSSGERVVDPIADLRPLCPNCHVLAHREKPPIPIDRLQELRRRLDISGGTPMGNS